MREILFKAKRIDNGEWVEGNIILSKDADEEYKAIIIPSVNSNMFTEDSGNEDLGFENWYKVDQSTICQYTGLTDKNGQKIWENDVVKCIDKNSDSEFIGVVEFGNPNSFYSWGYQLKHIKGDKPNLDILLWIDMEETGATCEVIGNLFDNPQLLKGGAE